MAIVEAHNPSPIRLMQRESAYAVRNFERGRHASYIHLDSLATSLIDNIAVKIKRHFNGGIE
jgi:hypothetical protein